MELSEIKTGDKVLYNENTILTVISVTPKGYIRTENGFLFTPTGFEHKNTTHKAHIRPVTEEEIKQLEEKKQMQRYICDTLARIKNIEKMDVSQAKAVNKLLDTLGLE